MQDEQPIMPYRAHLVKFVLAVPGGVIEGTRATLASDAQEAEALMRDALTQEFPGASEILIPDVAPLTDERVAELEHADHSGDVHRTSETYP